MRYILSILASFFLLLPAFSQTKENNKALADLFKSFNEDSYKLYPVQATANGDLRYNDQLPVTFTDSYNVKVKAFHTKYLNEIKKFDRNTLNANDKLSYDVFKYDREMALEGLTLKLNRMPSNQFNSFELSMGQLGSGTGAQPFKTVKDYDNWISRAKKYTAWSDSTIVYFKKGMAEGMMLPKALVVKMIPQLKSLQADVVEKSVFYGPVNLFPKSFTDADKKRLTEEFKDLITSYINPSYKKLENFLPMNTYPKQEQPAV